jgi:hypothetical protein
MALLFSFTATSLVCLVAFSVTRLYSYGRSRTPTFGLPVVFAPSWHKCEEQEFEPFSNELFVIYDA